MSEGMAERVEAVFARIGAACARAGRPAASVQLLAVTKGVDPERVSEAMGCGLRRFGESRVQEARAKIPLCPGTAEWHLIGHLQSNKVREAVRWFATIHSADSVERVRQIDAACGEAGVRRRVLIEVNLSGEGSKHGVAPEGAEGVLHSACDLAHVELAGLMTLPPVTPEPEGARPYFRRLRELRDELRARTGQELPELSMGMSHDFEVAIEEGANWVRLGTALFGRREKVT